MDLVVWIFFFSYYKTVYCFAEQVLTVMVCNTEQTQGQKRQHFPTDCGRLCYDSEAAALFKMTFEQRLCIKQKRKSNKSLHLFQSHWLVLDLSLTNTDVTLDKPQAEVLLNTFYFDVKQQDFSETLTEFL